jgi:Zn-dependent protease with chaperone function
MLLALSLLAATSGGAKCRADEVASAGTTTLAPSSATADPDREAIPSPASVPAPASSAAPVPVPEPSALASSHHRSGVWLWVAWSAWAVALPALIFFSGFSARLRTLALRVGRRWYGALVVYVALLACVWFAADLPLDFYADYIRPHQYGLSSQTFGKWLKDDVLSLILLIVAASLVVWIPLLLLKRSAQRWWWYAWLAGLPILVLVALIEPIWLEPLFNHFGPMQDKALEERILKLAARAGVDAADVYEVNKSVDTNELNAYVTGIGATKRIVLWDTTLKALSPAQVEQIMAHEMGHYVLRHVWKGLALGSLMLLAALWAVQVSAAWLLPRFSGSSQVRELDDIAALPLLALLLSVVAFLLTPAALAVSRHFEHEADRFGLELTHDNHTCATVFVAFVRHDLSYPRPAALLQFFRASHPSIAQRIEFCNTYHPWAQGEEERYSRYFH